MITALQHWVLRKKSEGKFCGWKILGKVILKKVRPTLTSLFPISPSVPDFKTPKMVKKDEFWGRMRRRSVINSYSGYYGILLENINYITIIVEQKRSARLISHHRDKEWKAWSLFFLPIFEAKWKTRQNGKTDARNSPLMM